MTCWTSCSNKLAALLLLAAVCLAGCAATKGTGDRREEAAGDFSPQAIIAVLPFENLSAASAPLSELRRVFVERLRAQGVSLLPEAELDAFMARHRLRYTGGINREIAQAFREETRATGVLITSLTLYHEEDPPKIGLASRLVAVGAEPRIEWAQSVAMTGNQTPGLLDLGLVHHVDVLRDRALKSLASSFADYRKGVRKKEEKSDRTFRPKVRYRAPGFSLDSTATVAILPFSNQGGRRFAGDLMGLHFLEALHRSGKFRVMEPGIVRDELLRFRVIIPEGASLDTAGILFGRLDADLLLSGKVLVYEDQSGAAGAPQAYFTAQAIDRENQELVWSSQSSNAGNEGVFFFDLGWVRTVQDLASRMAREVVLRLVEP